MIKQGKYTLSRTHKHTADKQAKRSTSSDHVFLGKLTSMHSRRKTKRTVSIVWSTISSAAVTWLERKSNLFEL